MKTLYEHINIPISSVLNFKISSQNFLFERSFQNWEVLTYCVCVCAGRTASSFLELVTLQLAAIPGKPCSTETYSLFKTSSIKTAGLLAGSCPCQGRWACTTTLFGSSVTDAGLCSWYATRSCTTTPFWPVAQFAVNCFTTIALLNFDKVVTAFCSTTGWPHTTVLDRLWEPCCPHWSVLQYYHKVISHFFTGHGTGTRRRRRRLRQASQSEVKQNNTSSITTVKVLAEAIFGIRYVPTFHGF